MKCKTCNQVIQEHKTGKTMRVKELGIEVETAIHHKGEELGNISIPKGWRLLRYEEIIALHNNKQLRKQLNMEDTWEFIEQPFALNKKKNYVARFDADSVRANLYCGWYPQDTRYALGVRFCRDVKQ